MDDEKLRFWEWINLKIRINSSDISNVYFRERQIWWVSLGKNVGSEENGKHENFERPVIILKKISKETFFALPTSRQVKEGKYRVVFQKNRIKYSVKISQLRVISAKRLIRLVGNISRSDFEKIRRKTKELL